jgi:hypothetical protein
LTSGFVKIRHYGLLANRSREGNLQRCRAVLLVVNTAARVAPADEAGAAAMEQRCAACGGVVWVVVARVPRPTVAEVCRLPLPQPPPDSG